MPKNNPIKLKDSKRISLSDATKALKKKIMDALNEHPELTKKSNAVAGQLMKRRDDIDAASGYKELRDIVVSVLQNEEIKNQPKAKEYLAKIQNEFDRKYARDPRPRSYNEQAAYMNLLQFVYNTLLKADNLGSPDVELKEEREAKEKLDSKQVKDSSVENQLLELIDLLSHAHDKIMEAQELAQDLVNDELLPEDVVYELDDLEAELSYVDFVGDLDAFKEHFGLDDFYDNLEPSDEDEEDEDFDF